MAEMSIRGVDHRCRLGESPGASRRWVFRPGRAGGRHRRGRPGSRRRAGRQRWRHHWWRRLSNSTRPVRL